MKDVIEIRESKFGKGLFATKKIPAGSVVCKIPLGTELNFQNSLQLKDRESHALQIDFDRYILCVPPFLYSNHSCNPNCGVNTNFEMVTLRDVREDEELFWDYSTSMLERHWTLSCACGEKNCRKIITDFDLLPQKLQNKYLDLNIVLPFIVHFVQQQLAKSA
ncbi:MAG TPA: SET domain-containing protein [Flavisolibacter sp.]|nr:SET domain-containing protein [Flavisolibacter sp.]HWJ91199.1 SET domain-containing protein [Flavisolibacter sp.]